MQFNYIENHIFLSGKYITVFNPYTGTYGLDELPHYCVLYAVFSTKVAPNCHYKILFFLTQI